MYKRIYKLSPNITLNKLDKHRKTCLYDTNTDDDDEYSDKNNSDHLLLPLKKAL